MMRAFAALLALAAAAPLAAQPAREGLQPTPAALAIFERDWVADGLGVNFYDADRDILLDPNEARSAAEGFRRLADTNGDGRVTPDEYRGARAFILASY